MSKQLIAVFTAEKLNTTSTVKIYPLNNINLLVTNLNPNDALLQPYLAAGLNIL